MNTFVTDLSGHGYARTENPDADSRKGKENAFINKTEKTHEGEKQEIIT